MLFQIAKRQILSKYFRDERNQKGNFSGFIDFGDGYVGDMFEMLANDFNITVANFGPDGLDQTLVIFMAPGPDGRSGTDLKSE